jgi:hypothetical protein
MVDVAQLVEPRIVIPAVAGSSPVVHPTFVGWVVCWLKGLFGPLAQLVEQLTLNQLVVGSIPTRPTNLLKNKKFFDVTRRNSKASPIDQNFPHSISKNCSFSLFSSAKCAESFGVLCARRSHRTQPVAHRVWCRGTAVRQPLVNTTRRSPRRVASHPFSATWPATVRSRTTC